LKWVDNAGGEGERLTETAILNELNGRRKSLFITAASQLRQPANQPDPLLPTNQDPNHVCWHQKY